MKKKIGGKAGKKIARDEDLEKTDSGKKDEEGRVEPSHSQHL